MCKYGPNLDANSVFVVNLFSENLVLAFLKKLLKKLCSCWAAAFFKISTSQILTSLPVDIKASSFFAIAPLHILYAKSLPC